MLTTLVGLYYAALVGLKVLVVFFSAALQTVFHLAQASLPADIFKVGLLYIGLILAVLLLLGLGPLFFGIQCLRGKKSGAEGALVIGVVWMGIEFLLLISFLLGSKEMIKTDMQTATYASYAVGRWLLQAVAIIFAAVGRKQAYLYDLWTVRQKTAAAGKADS